MQQGQGGALEEERARTVIGADGAFSQVAETAGWPRLATVPLVQAVVRPPKDLPLDMTRVWFIPEDTPYFWPIQGKTDEISERPLKGLRVRCWEDGNIVSLATRVPSAGAG